MKKAELISDSLELHTLLSFITFVKSKNVKITKAEFVISNTDIDLCPKDGKPEYAFIGRSNVGKSSLINMITDRNKLAKTSGRPGKTQLINHFTFNLILTLSMESRSTNRMDRYLQEHHCSQSQDPSFI